MALRDGTIDDLARVIGYSAMRELEIVRGGTDLLIPTCASRAAQLIQWIGPDKADAAIEAYGGCTFSIRNGKGLKALDDKIVPLLGRLRDHEIATAVGCTERTVRNVRARTGRLPGVAAGADA